MRPVRLEPDIKSALCPAGQSMGAGEVCDEQQIAYFTGPATLAVTLRGRPGPSRVQLYAVSARGAAPIGSPLTGLGDMFIDAVLTDQML